MSSGYFFCWCANRYRRDSASGNPNSDLRASTDSTERPSFSAAQPSLVLLDLGLPGLDGWEVAKRIRELPSLKKVMMVAITGWDSDVGGTVGGVSGALVGMGIPEYEAQQYEGKLREIRVVKRMRLEHADRANMRSELTKLPPATPIAMEGAFGWANPAIGIRYCRGLLTCRPFFSYASSLCRSPARLSSSSAYAASKVNTRHATCSDNLSAIIQEWNGKSLCGRQFTRAKLATTAFNSCPQCSNLWWRQLKSLLRRQNKKLTQSGISASS